MKELKLLQTIGKGEFGGELRGEPQEGLEGLRGIQETALPSFPQT
jgi:hypothetical protein